MTALILHLSDIHIKSSADPIRSRASQIASCAFRDLPCASHVFMVVSGDIAFSGSEEQYTLAEIFLNEIREHVTNERNVAFSTLVLPGNHDCDFGRNNGARTALIKSLESGTAEDIDETFIAICTTVQEPFLKFRSRIESSHSITKDDTLWRTSRFEVESFAVQFDCLNVAWASRIHEEPGKLFFPVKRYLSESTSECDLRILAIHHPVNWFGQPTYRPFRKLIRSLANIILSGHEHAGNVGLNFDTDSDESAYVEGCVLQGAQDLSDSSFNVIVLDLTEKQFTSTKYVWHESTYVESEEGSWTDYRKLPAKQTSQFPISDDFQKILDDPGASLWHPAKVELCLSDIFVFPDMVASTGGKGGERVSVSSRKLLSPDTLAEGVILQAEEKAGSSSLLYQLFREYHKRGFIPLLVRGPDLRRAETKEIDGVIRRAVEAQYGKGLLTRFDQAAAEKRILLIDDFDESAIRAKAARSRLLQHVQKRFRGFVLTVGEMFEIGELLSKDDGSDLSLLTHFRLQPFGYARRGELIERWVALNSDGGLDEAEYIAKCDTAERLINAVMRKNVIPSLPLYLLTLLQGIEGGQTGEFQDTALGHYYQFLITGALKRAGVKPDKITELFQYAAHLAWEFHRSGRTELGALELRAFNEAFSRKWVTVDFSERIGVLIESRILMRIGDDFRFRYPYVYYYLKGQYLAEYHTDAEVQDHIRRCCSHLYVRDYANTMLFLAHHKSDDDVLELIASSLQSLFAGRTPVTFDGDTNEIKSLIDGAPRLIYSGESPMEVRRKNKEIRDELDDDEDGLSECEETNEKLSLLAQMTMLFRVTEILGQVLKNQYAKITREKKSALLTGLFNGPLRAISDFYEFLKCNPDSVAQEIENVLTRKGIGGDVASRKTAARKVAAELIELVTYAFIARAAHSANSESLLEDVDAAVKANSTTAFHLIEMGVLLDSPRALPRKKLSDLAKKTEDDLVSARLLRLLVLNRLYMFKTAEKDMQWLQGEIGFDLDAQHRIAYQEKTLKRLD